MRLKGGYEIRYWAEGEWFPVDAAVLGWLNATASHPTVVCGALPDVRWNADDTQLGARVEWG